MTTIDIHKAKKQYYQAVKLLAQALIEIKPPTFPCDHFMDATNVVTQLMDFAALKRNITEQVLVIHSDKERNKE